MSSQPKTFVSPEKYLEQERLADSKCEYFQGEVFAMAGTSTRHVSIVTNVVIELRQQRPENHWDFVEFDDLAQSLQLTSIGCILPLTEVYDKIEWS
jgi:Uma2 family endonuclease